MSLNVDSKEAEKKDNSIILGTHSGIFHCDEIIALSILLLLFEEKYEIFIIRTRDVELLKNNCKILIDIGGGVFDHHQPGGNGKRENGVNYASAGLIWNAFGKELITLLSSNKLSYDSVNKLFNQIDLEIIQKIDEQDNGLSTDKHNFEYIQSYLPAWNSEKIDYNKNFEECLIITKSILEKTIIEYISKELAQQEIINKIFNPSLEDNELLKENIILLPNQTIPWLETIIKLNNIIEQQIDFVVFPYPTGGYALQCVPISLDNKFSKRIPLPETWAGLTNSKLAFETGVKTATFCHNGLFFARADKIEDIIELCILAKNHSKTLKRKK